MNRYILWGIIIVLLIVGVAFWLKDRGGLTATVEPGSLGFDGVPEATGNIDDALSAILADIAGDAPAAAESDAALQNGIDAENTVGESFNLEL
ncbi:MAG: hypothetical protein HY436_01200 [Candidatus Liptonbacteria bacterium]|nr:hypothetical protein [Candidatus Liptonbacteria bacterium]